MASAYDPLYKDAIAQEELRKFRNQDKEQSKHATKIINEIVQSTFDELAKGEHEGPY
jgi:hypothetical protein